jgi:hypothetical protein
MILKEAVNNLWGNEFEDAKENELIASNVLLLVVKSMLPHW